MIQLHFVVKKLKVGKSMGVLHLFVLNYVKYANTEGLYKGSYLMYTQATQANSLIPV